MRRVLRPRATELDVDSLGRDGLRHNVERIGRNRDPRRVAGPVYARHPRLCGVAPAPPSVRTPDLSSVGRALVHCRFSGER